MIFQKMLEKNPDQILDATESFQEAAYRGHYEVCRFILKEIENKVLDVNPKRDHRDNDKTILHFAAEDGYLEVFKLIINNVEDKNPSNDGLTPFHVAARHGNLNICKLIVKNIGKEYPRDNHGRTALHDAAQFGHFEVCEYLLHKFDDQNPSDITGWTPLHLAAEECHLMSKSQAYKVCKLIIDHISDKNPKDLEGNTPLHGAVLGDNFRLYKYLCNRVINKNPENNEGVTPFHVAVEEGHLNFCKFIIKKLKDKNPKDANGNTALHYAAFGNGNLEIYRYIMDFVEDKNPKNKEGDTPLHCVAVQSKNVALAKLILENIDEKNPQNNEGHTLLYSAKGKVKKCIKDAISAKASDTGNMEDHNPKPQIKQTNNHANCPSNQDDNAAQLASYGAVGRSENPGVPVLFGGHNLPPMYEIGLTDLPGAMPPPGTTGLSYESDTIEATTLPKKKIGFLSKVRGFFGFCLQCCPCFYDH